MEYQPALAPADDERSTTSVIPPQVLARWAAVASARAYLATIPRQARA
ncbi:hypothetical protein GXB85_08910 [Cellulomonas sp. APG4]|nr:hypothetical protein [Cellulomonas sp. APG4]NCT91066.1 hypothetical protein [Cellulomonas sp. APG4]